MIGTTFNPADAGSGAGYNAPILSNGNRTLQLTSNNNNITMDVCVDGYAAGKYYLEFTMDSGASRTIELGLIQNAASRQIGAGSTGAAVVANNGATGVNGSATATVDSFTTNGLVACLAWDLDNRNFWVRVGAGGAWKGNGAGANPATNTSGISFSGLTGIMKPFGYLNSFSSPPLQITMNAGGSAFTGAVPAGFTPGWPSLVDLSQSGMLFHH